MHLHVIFINNGGAVDSEGLLCVCSYDWLLMSGNRSTAFPCAQPVDDQKADQTLCSHSWQELL